MEKQERKVPAKNYLLLLILFIVSFLIVYYFYRWYIVYSEYQNEIPVIRDSLTEMTEEEMEHYVRETPTTTIYVCTASKTECRNFEKSFKKLVEKESLKEYIIYVNLNDQNQDTFVSRFNQNHPYKKSGLKDYPALIYFEDGEVLDILQASENKELKISDVVDFIDSNEIGSTY